MQTDAPSACPGLCEPPLGCQAETPSASGIYCSLLLRSVKALQSPAFWKAGENPLKSILAHELRKIAVQVC